jgi:hypothetical protein
VWERALLSHWRSSTLYYYYSLGKRKEASPWHTLSISLELEESSPKVRLLATHIHVHSIALFPIYPFTLSLLLLFYLFRNISQALGSSLVSDSAF